MAGVLLVGYGNLSRRDDGVAYHILQRLRKRLGHPSPALEDDYEEMGGSIPGDARLAMMCAHQLGPEMAEALAQFDVVVFIDAHIASAGWEPVHWQEITPGIRASLVSHHMKPDTLLALCGALYGHTPKGYILSILGTDFDFGMGLSPTTAALVDEAVDGLLELLRTKGMLAK